MVGLHPNLWNKPVSLMRVTTRAWTPNNIRVTVSDKTARGCDARIARIAKQLGEQPTATLRTKRRIKPEPVRLLPFNWR